LGIPELSADLLVKLAIFFIGSGSLVFVSRASLRMPGSHGFYRFLAWECMLVLLLIVVGRWFVDPFSFAQIVSWLFMSISAFLALHGVYLLRQAEHTVQERAGEPLFALEKTTRLVTHGAYRYIRHPLYSSLLFLSWGLFLKRPIALAGVMAIAATGFLIATAKADEAECIRFFGPAYEQYVTRTKMFIPFIF
jgi:protein-S-isoprenylcysteine O-methyltransferase Ste14